MSWNYIDLSLLKNIDLFKELEEAHLHEIIVLMKTVNAKTGQFIFMEGKSDNCLYLLIEGEVRISKNIPGVGEEALAILPKGSCFGEMALIEGRLTRSASAIANSDCTLAKLERDDFWKLLEKDKDFAIKILWSFVRLLSLRLRNSNDKVAFLAMSNLFE